MPVINCVCGHRMDASDDDALFQAVRRHSDDAHSDFQISDATIRKMVEATARSTDWNGTLTPIETEPKIRELTPALVGDFLRFFDSDAFMDNPIWASCYCLFYQFGGQPDEWERRTGEENRRDKAELIRSGNAHGYLAYIDGRPAAWCHAAPRATLSGITRAEEFRIEDDEAAIGSIVCFTVAAPYRRQGLATKLLDAASAGFRAQGLTIAEAYPAKNPTSDAGAYHGPLAMYEAAGFTRLRETEHYFIVRKPL